jgi:hypothetical protein
MLTEIIAKYIQEKRQAEIRDNSKFRVSDAGRCHLMRYWKRQGKPASDMPDDRQLRVFEAGHVFHIWLQDILRPKGALIEVPVEDEHRMGHVDAIVQGDEGVILYDFKTVHSRKFHHNRKEGGNGDIHYAMQAYTYATMLPPSIQKELTDIRIAYISKDDLCIEEVSVFRMPDLPAKTTKDWEILLDSWIKKVEPNPNPLNWECKYCIYRSSCFYPVNCNIKL